MVSLRILQSLLATFRTEANSCSATRSRLSFFFSSRRRHTRLTYDWSSDVCSSDLEIRFIDNPATTVPPTEGKREDLYAWIHDNLFAASPNLQQLQRVSTAIGNGNVSSFTATPFRNRIAQVYQSGAGLVVAANLERVVRSEERRVGKWGRGGAGWGRVRMK